MAKNADKTQKLIASYIGKDVTAKLDGELFEHSPGTFRFRFHDPDELAAQLALLYPDQLGAMDCLDDDGDWVSDDLIPVAAVSAAVADEDDDDDKPAEFAWVFLDWSVKKAPGLRICTVDDWGDERTLDTFDQLKLVVE